MEQIVDINKIRGVLPHRYPFLLVDKVIEFSSNESLTAVKNVTVNEPYFQGHFPHQPVMPGVMLIEAMAQACAILSALTLDTAYVENGVYYFVGIDKARFKKPVIPGDQLIIKTKIARTLKGIWKFNVIAYVDDVECCTADIMCTYKE